MNNLSKNPKTKKNNNSKEVGITLFEEDCMNSSKERKFIKKDEDLGANGLNKEKNDFEKDNEKSIEEMYKLFDGQESSDNESCNNDEIKEKKQFLCKKHFNDNDIDQVWLVRTNEEFNEKTNQIKELDIHEINEIDSSKVLNDECNLGNINSIYHLPKFGQNQLMAKDVDNKNLITNNCKYFIIEYVEDDKKRVNDIKLIENSLAMKNIPFNKRQKTLKDFLEINNEKIIEECKEKNGLRVNKPLKE